MFAYLREENFFIFEVFFTLKLIASMSPGLATGMLLQDKICLFRHNQSAYFCQNIQLQWNTTAEENMKDLILTETSQFSQYR